MPVIYAKPSAASELAASDVTNDSSVSGVSVKDALNTLDSTLITDHGALTGLFDDDHPQYINNSEMTTISGDIIGQIITDHGTLTGLTDNDHAQYLTGVSGSTPLRGGGQTIGFDETVIDHDNLTNFIQTEHRIINDSGTSVTELWSASQIESRVVTATGSLTTDHGALTGLSDDDHTQYFLADSSRAFSGDLLPNASGTLDIGSLALPFRSLYLTGSSLYMDGNKILFTDGNDIVLASPDGSIVISGSVNLSDAVVYHADLTGLGDDDHTQYLLADGTRALTGDWDYGAQTISGTGTVSVGKLHLGTDNDFTMYHNGSNAYIDTLTGSFYLRTVGTENAIVMAPNGAVSLYYDAALKLATSNTGIVVDGVVNSTSVTTDALVLGGTNSMEGFSIDDALSGDSDISAVSEKAIKTYVDDKIIDHGGLVGLDDDDHPQYFLADSSRAFSGNLLPNASGTLNIGSLSLPFNVLYLTGAGLYMNGIKTLYTDGPNIVLASPDGSIVISGSVNLSDAVVYHADLTGLGADDHSQYHNDARGDARYYTETELDAGQLDNRYHTESEITTISGDLQANVDTNTTAIDLNTTHRSSDGSDHSIVGSNTSAITANTTLITTVSGDLQTNIDALTHDGFADFVANEHLDWTTDLSADNMHDNNIVASNVTQHEGSIDHGSIAGLSDDDHTQYLLADGTRHAATLVVDGDLIVSGTRFIANTETVLIEDNLLVINNGEVGAGVTLGEAGIEVDRGSEVNYRFMFDETNDVFVVGVSGSEQAVATRLDSSSMTASGIPYWDDGNIRFPTAAGFIFTGGNARVPASTPLNDADLTRKDYVDSAITTATGSLTSDHGSLTGLSADDHTQYILVDGSRAFTGNILPSASGTLDIGSASMPFGNLYLDGASLYMGDDEVIYLVANGLVLESPSGNPITLTTAGGDALITDASGGIKLNAGSQYVNEFSTDTTLSGNSDTAIPTEKAVKTYVDTEMTTISGDIITQIVTDHGALTGLSDDDHTQYSLVNGTRAFSNTISGISPTAGPHLTTKTYVDSQITTATGALTGNDITMERIAGSTFSTSQHMQDIFHSSGWSSGGTITSGTTTTVDVAAGTGFIRDASSSIATISYFDWTSSGTLSVPTDTTRYIGVEYNSGSPQVVVRSSYNWDFFTDFPLGSVVNESGYIHILNATHAIGDHASNMIQRNYETMPLKRDDRTGGLILGEEGTRNITLTTGALWERLERFTISAISTSGTDTFDRYYRDGSGGWTKEAGQTQWNNTQYDDGDGGLATIANNKYSTQYFYIELDGEIVSLYGQAQYTQLASAQGDTPPSTVPDRLNIHGKLIGRVVFKESAASASLVESVFDTSFSTTLVTDHGNLAGLSDDDHTLYSLADGTRDFSGVVIGVDPTLAAHLTTKTYVDTEITTATGALTTDHGSLTGLTDDDHPQYINNTEMTTISGDLSAEIDSDISTHEAGSSHDGRYYTETELDAGQLDNRYHTESEITTISGDLQTNIDALTHDGFADFVTNEHLDWTTDLSADNMHDNNIVASNVTQHEASIDHDALTNFATNEHFTFASVSGTIDHDTLLNFASNEHFTEASIDHGSIAGLSDDDHTQYLRTDGTRQLTGTWNFGAQTISGTGDFYTSGNVGIGTITPGEKLEVAGSIDLTTVDTDEYKIGGNRAIAMPVDNTNIAVGPLAGVALTTGAGFNTLVGNKAGTAITTGDNNILIGYQAGKAVTSSSSMVAVGTSALLVATVANVGIGERAGVAITTGNANVIIGKDAMSSTTTNVMGNVAVGDLAGDRFSTNENVAIGNVAMQNAAPSNAGNIGIGRSAAYALTGGGTTAVGYQAMTQGSLAGSNNSVFGYKSGWTMGDGGNNSLFGYHTGYAITTGDGNIGLGYQAGDNIISGDSNIIIGYDIDAPSATDNGQLSIGNLIFGTGIDGTGTNISTGNVGIGINNPSEKLHLYISTGAIAEQIETGGANSAALRLTTLNNDYALQCEDNSFNGIGFYQYAPATAGWKFVISTTGKVGIGGITNPDHSLHINPEENPGMTIKSSSVDIGIDLENTAANGDNWRLQSVASPAGTFYIYNLSTSTSGLTIGPSGDVALVNGTTVNEFSTDGTLAGNSDDALPTEKATKTYVDTEITTATGSLTSDHGALTGLSDDDHTQYILADGSRAFTGNIQANASGTLDIGSVSNPFNNLYLDGTSIYMGAAEVIYLVANGLVLKSPSGNPIILTTAGGDALITDASGGIKLNTGSQYVNEFSTDTTLSGNSDTAIPTEKAVKTYVDTETNNAVIETDIKAENESANCNGSTTAFTLDYTPVVNSIQVFLNGLLQEMGSGKDYTHSGTSITFAVAPLTDDILIIHYIVNN